VEVAGVGRVHRPACCACCGYCADCADSHDSDADSAPAGDDAAPRRGHRVRLPILPPLTTTTAMMQYDSLCDDLYDNYIKMQPPTCLHQSTGDTFAITAAAEEEVAMQH